MLDLGDILRHGSPPTPAGEPTGDDGTCGDCADGKCHGTDPDDCECARHSASVERDAHPADCGCPGCTGQCYCAGCIGTGRCDDDLGRDDDYRCCALDEGHDGPCAWICHHCQGSGRCPACDDGLETDDTYIAAGRKLMAEVTVNLPDQDVT